jgi:hypothetical protein
MNLPRHHRLHLFALSSLAVAQPLYDLVGRHATFLVAHGAGAATILGLIGALSIGLPLVAVALVDASRLVSPKAAGWVQAACIGLLAGLLAAIGARELAPPMAAGLATMAAVAAAIAYRASAVRFFLTVLSPAAVIFPVLFVTTTPAGRLLLPDALVRGAEGLAERPPIVLVVFDEMGSFTLAGPEGAIDPDRFPNLAALAATSTWFPNALAADAFTTNALPAILTGTIGGERRKLPIAADHPDSLFTWLSNLYELQVSEPITQLCPQSLCPETAEFDARGFASDVLVLYRHLVAPGAGQLPPLGLGWMDFEAARGPADGEWRLEAYFHEVSRRGRAQAFRDFVARVRGPSRPVLHFVHNLLPHDPYQYFASGRLYAQAAPLDGLSQETLWLDDPWVVEAARDRHIEQARFADALLGELIERLEAEDLFDDALIVVTSDHGSAFMPGQLHRGVTPENQLEVLAVPLVVKLPGQAVAAVNAHQVSSIDIVPTIATALGGELPWPVAGAPMLDDEFPHRQAIVHAGGASEPPADIRAEAARRARAPRPDAAYRPLVGRRAADFPSVAATGLRAVSDSFQALEDVRPETGFVPALVHGRIEGRPAGARPLVLALAVDGTIHAVTRTFAWDGTPHHFSALLPEPALAAGANRLEVFAVDAQGGSFRLRPIGGVTP